MELRVPLRADVIQVGAGGAADMGRIRVVKEMGSITVRRLDGVPIQVGIVCDEPEVAPTGSHVFEAPIHELRLVRVCDGAGPARWCLDGDGECIGHLGRIKQFADVVGTFAAAKQRADRAVSTHTAGVASIVG